MLLKKNKIRKVAATFPALLSFSEEAYANMPREAIIIDLAEQFNKVILPKAVIGLLVIIVLYCIFSKKEKRYKRKGVLYLCMGFSIAYIVLMCIIKLIGPVII